MKNEFIYKRKSVREFKDIQVPMEAIQEMIKEATQAPSGKNAQNWHFVVVRNKEKIEKMAEAVYEKGRELSNNLDEKTASNFMKMLKYYTVFKNAPTVVMIFSSKYESSGKDILMLNGASNEEVEKLESVKPGVQNIGAAMENLLLSAANMGYGGCYMTGPAFASDKMCEVIAFNKEGYNFSCLTPIGIPLKENINSPKRKSLDEVITIIE
ncbi:nitroreductase family protein [Helicovermis profundi]|uniref:Nitroreductase family protein n=1 Tax=Helicovermis profundi TaxID=3065157 RepID=A0AAU9EB68_9FIRM|nr:nitroreductase family protein [Clostridia bacterium S502]